MGVSINGGTPKWMVYKGNSYMKVDDLAMKETKWICKRLQDNLLLENGHGRPLKIQGPP